MSWDHLRSAELKLMQPPQHGFQSYAATTSFSCVTRVSGCMVKEIIWREVFRNYLNVFNILSVGVIWVHFSGFQRTRVDTCRLCDATASFRCLSEQILLDLTKRKQSRSQQKQMWSWKTFLGNTICIPLTTFYAFVKSVERKPKLLESVHLETVSDDGGDCLNNDCIQDTVPHLGDTTHCPYQSKPPVTQDKTHRKIYKTIASIQQRLNKRKCNTHRAELGRVPKIH